MAEKERFSHKVADDFDCTVATKAFASLAQGRSDVKSQVAATRSPPLHPPPAAWGYFSLSHRYAVLGSNLSPPTKKATLLGGFRGGEGEIRTLEPLLTVTRFPIVRARPATRLLRNCSAQIKLFYWRLKHNITKNLFCQ